MGEEGHQIFTAVPPLEVLCPHFNSISVWEEPPFLIRMKTILIPVV